MKKAFSIFLVLAVLLSSIHFTVATHFCGGEVAAVKAGMEGTKASCGMEDGHKECPNPSGISSASCCKNSSSVLSVDHFKVPSLLEIQKINLTLLQVYLIPVLHIVQALPLNNISFTNEAPPHSLLSLPGRLAFICVFRK
jgi:hypothetical protein